MKIYIMKSQNIGTMEVFIFRLGSCSTGKAEIRESYGGVLHVVFTIKNMCDLSHVPL